MDALVVCNSCEKLNRVPFDRARLSQPTCGNCRKPLPFRDGVQEMTARTLPKLVERSDRPVVVDFWATWCGPCRAFAPTFKSVAQELGDRFIFAKLDTQANEPAARAYQIRGIPTLILFKAGREVARQSGAMPAAMFKSFLIGHDPAKSA